MMNRVGVVIGKLLSIALIKFICYTVGNGAGPGKAYFGDALGMLLREQKLIQNHWLLVLYFADYTRGVLLGSSTSHGDGFSVTGVNAIQFIDDMQHIVAASFFAVGYDVDARSVLVFDSLESSLVQQSRKLGSPEFFLAAVERKAKAVE